MAYQLSIMKTKIKTIINNSLKVPNGYVKHANPVPYVYKQLEIHILDVMYALIICILSVENWNVLIKIRT